MIHALNPSVTALIKNLNGNHVIQKCLHYLSKEEKNQFIYDAICIHCVEVASHKHGCCVLQRCFDYATFKQKDQLVKEISKHALVLVQGPFGNYVVQYVLDLGLVTYSESINQKFIGHICSLSSQKFSSNVIEKVNLEHKSSHTYRRVMIKHCIVYSHCIASYSTLNDQ